MMPNHEKSAPHKVLYDISLGAQKNYAGIPQDTRLMFKALSQSPKVDLTGMIMELGGYYTLGIARRRRTKARSHFKYKDAAEYIAHLSSSIYDSVKQGSSKGSFLKDAIKFIIHVLRRSIYFPRAHILRELPPKIFSDSIWRLFFAKSLAAADKGAIDEKKVVYSTLTVDAIYDGIYSLGPKTKLDTHGYDFVIFQDVRPVRVSAGTVKICRYHDAIPISHPDTQTGASWGEAHFRAVNLCRKDTYWVCNSEGTREELLSLFPMIGDRASVIPCAVPAPDPLSEKISVAEICGQPADKPLRYILSVSTLEPRKNFLSVIAAWESIVATDDPDLKLVIVGTPGWKFQEILKAIQSRAKTGKLIHLQNLPSFELQALYRRAEAFVFPSFAEGFGLPPVEALACSTPSVVSDTMNSRWVMEDSALYVDPYDIKDIANGIRRLTSDKDREETRRALLKSKDKALQRFSIDTIAAQWEKLFAELKEKRDKMN